MTKKTTKKKTAAKKAAKVMTNVMDSIIEEIPDQSAPVSIQEPVHKVFDEDDYNPYAPKGFSGSWEKEEAALDREIQGIIMPPDEPEPQPAPVEKPSLPATVVAERVAEELVKRAMAIRPLIPIIPPDALTGDALVIQRLINAVNHLYGIARLTKGQKGPQPDDLRKIQDNIVKAKYIITRLS